MGTAAKLFKDTIHKTNYRVLAREFVDAVEKHILTEFLFGTAKLELYSEHGEYKEGQHNHCDGLTTDVFTEKRLCKCLYYRNGKCFDSQVCQTCSFQNRYDIIGDFNITDYEVPAYYYGEGIGKIDLIISGGKKEYATEVKPFKGNDETLLRMIAEIATYTAGYPLEKYEKAIAFFEKTPQADEFKNPLPEIKYLIDKMNIAVFCFVNVGESTYKICRL